MRPEVTRAVVATAVVTAVVGVGVGIAGAGVATAEGDCSGDAGGRSAKNVVLVVGDGMGLGTRTAVRLATVGRTGQLAMDSLRYAGWTSTDPDDPDEAVTDSAASATAFATGVRTVNGTLGVDADGEPVPTLLEVARDRGKATGLVTTSTVTDATPGAFGAHVRNRGAQSEVARQYVDVTRPDVILGGGEDWWFPKGEEGAVDDVEGSSTGTRGDLVRRAVRAGYDHVSTREELDASSADRILGLFADGRLFHAAEERPGVGYDPVVPLAAMTEKALEVLCRDADGFFLLVEEEGTDEFAHSNNAEGAIRAGQALDETVALVDRFAAAHPGTLVVVVGDHETGGLTVEEIDRDEPRDADSREAGGEDGPFPIAGSEHEFTVDWTTGSHTGQPTPLTAEGPGAERLARAQHTTDVHDVILDVMG